MPGGREPRHSDGEILRFVVHARGPAVSTGEVRDEFGYQSASGARDRLDALVDQGDLATKSVGPARIFWLTDAGVQRLADDADHA